MSQSTALYVCDRCKARVFSKGWGKHRGKALCIHAMTIKERSAFLCHHSKMLSAQMLASFKRFAVPYTAALQGNGTYYMITTEPWVGILIACIASAATIGATPYTVLKVGATDLAVRAMLNTGDVKNALSLIKGQIEELKRADANTTNP